MNIYGLCSLVTRERAKEMNDWYVLVWLGMRGNFEAALSRVTVARLTRLNNDR